MASGGDMVGTSVGAPFTAAFLARLQQALKTTGTPNIHDVIYPWNGTTAFRPITVGTNAPPSGEGYSAGIPWNPCTGLGPPDGGVWLTNLKST